MFAFDGTLLTVVVLVDALAHTGIMHFLIHLIESLMWQQNSGCNAWVPMCTVVFLFFFFLWLFNFSASICLNTSQECSLNLHGLFSHFWSFRIMTWSEEALNVYGVAAFCPCLPLRLWLKGMVAWTCWLSRVAIHINNSLIQSVIFASLQITQGHHRELLPHDSGTITHSDSVSQREFLPTDQLACNHCHT